MAIFDSRLEELFLNKPECVINLPEWLLSSKKIDEYRAISRPAIVEMAGRDSVAAAVKGVEERGYTDLFPTYAYTGTEYGPWAAVKEAVRRIAGRLPGVKVHDPIIIGSPEFWRALNGRFINELIDRYTFYTPCIGCHLYLHSLRIPIARILGNIPIISGERELHNGDIKINQIAEALDAYQGIAEDFRIKLLFPLRHIIDGGLIEDILDFHWEEGKEQLGCVLSGNYRRTDGSNRINKEDAIKYLEEFALPCVREIIESYVEGQVPDHEGIAKSVLNNITGASS